MRISTKEIRKAVDILCQHMEDSGLSNIDIEAGYYWMVFPGEDRDFSKQPDPSELVVGDIVEDTERILKLIKNPEDVVGYDFINMASLFRNIGDTIV